MINHQTRRTVFLSFVFVLGLLIVDQALLKAGEYLTETPFWEDRIVPHLASTKIEDVLILGGCRAALQLDPKILEAQTGKNFFNAGKVVDGLGNIEFLLNVYLSQSRDRRI